MKDRTKHMLKCTKIAVSRNRFRKCVVFGVIMLFVGISLLQQIQLSVKADIIYTLIYSDDTIHYNISRPTILLLYPTEGDIVNETITIRWTAYDTEDDSNLSIYLYLSNDTGNNCSSFFNNPYENTAELQWNTIPYPNGGYTLLIKALNSDGDSNVDFCTFQIQNYEDYQEQYINNKPLKPDRPFGQVYGKLRQEYSYKTSTTDSDGNLMYYFWDWGDGCNSGWLGPYHSGVNCEEKHAWMEIGSYNITVKAKDTYGEESVWSDPLYVTIPSTYNPILKFLDLIFQQFPYLFPFLQKLFGY